MFLYQFFAEHTTPEEQRQLAIWIEKEQRQLSKQSPIDVESSSRTDYTRIKQFQVPPILIPWMQDPHNNKLYVSKKGDINVSGVRTAPVGKLTFEFDEHHEFSNYWNHMNLQLPMIIFDPTTQSLRFDSRTLITWNSIEALFQWFKLWIVGIPAAGDQKTWSQLTPDQAKQKARGLTQSLNVPYQAYEHRLFRFICAMVTIKFYSNPRLMKMLLDTEDALLLEITNWRDGVWGGKKGESSHHKLGWILMNIRETIRKDRSLSKFLQTGALGNDILDFIPRAYNSGWLFNGFDVNGSDYPFLYNQNSIRELDSFGFAYPEYY